jgi:hypothetical protein
MHEADKFYAASASPGGSRHSQGKAHFIERASCPNHEGFALFNQMLAFKAALPHIDRAVRIHREPTNGFDLVAFPTAFFAAFQSAAQTCAATLEKPPYAWPKCMTTPPFS